MEPARSEGRLLGSTESESNQNTSNCYVCGKPPSSYVPCTHGYSGGMVTRWEAFGFLVRNSVQNSVTEIDCSLMGVVALSTKAGTDIGDCPVVP